jgi:hypothetical protein
VSRRTARSPYVNRTKSAMRAIHVGASL